MSGSIRDNLWVNVSCVRLVFLGNLRVRKANVESEKMLKHGLIKSDNLLQIRILSAELCGGADQNSRVIWQTRTNVRNS